MNIYTLGIDHKNCPLEIMEKVNVTAANLPGFYKSLGLKEAVWLQTCNRRELVFIGDDNNLIAKKLEKYFSVFAPWDSIRGIEAVTRLFRTAAGLNSAIVGETQVLGQVRDAYANAKKTGAAGKSLEKLFSAAIYAGRTARQISGISTGAVSAAQAAVVLAKGKIELKGTKALIIGAGKINETAAKYLKKAGAGIIFVANRSRKKAGRLAKTVGASVVDFYSLKDALTECEMVISATSAPHYVLRMDNAGAVLQSRNKQLLIIDLAVPRDVDPALASDKVEILNMDDINRFTGLNMEKRLSAAIAADNTAVELAWRWMHETENRNKKKPAGFDTIAGADITFETQPQRA